MKTSHVVTALICLFVLSYWTWLIHETGYQIGLKEGVEVATKTYVSTMAQKVKPEPKEEFVAEVTFKLPPVVEKKDYEKDWMEIDFNGSSLFITDKPAPRSVSHHDELLFRRWLWIRLRQEFDFFQ